MRPWRRKVVPKVRDQQCACGQVENLKATIETGNCTVTKCLRRMERSASRGRVIGPTAKEGDVVVVNSLRTEAHTDVEKLPIKD